MYISYELLNSFAMLIDMFSGVMPRYKSSVHCNDVVMGVIASQITSCTVVYSTAYSKRRSKKTPNSASPTFVKGIHRWMMNSPHRWPVTRKMFPFGDVIMIIRLGSCMSTPQHQAILLTNVDLSAIEEWWLLKFASQCSHPLTLQSWPL